MTTIDPLAYKYTSRSPYAYVANNPLIFIDHDWNKVVYANGSSPEFKQQE